MKKIIFSISLLIIASAAFSQDQLIARRLLIDNAGAQTWHTLTKDVPYTLTHSKAGNGSFTVNENGSPLGNYPEAATITPIEVKLKNTWLINGYVVNPEGATAIYGGTYWTETSIRYDAGAAIPSTNPVLSVKSDSYIQNIPNALVNAQCVQVRNLYGAVLDVYLSQEIQYLPAGTTYEFSVFALGYSGAASGNNAYLYAEEDGVKTISGTPITFSGDWQSWGTKQSFSYTKNTDKAIKFGVYLNKTSSGGAGNTDGWKFTNFSLTAQ